MKARSYRKLALVGLVPLLLFATGCLATRKFVRNNQAPLESKVQKVDQQTVQNAQDIKELGKTTETGISQAQTSAEQANQAATQADQHAQAANQTAGKGLTAANQAQTMLLNLQHYQAAHHTAITFKVNKSALTADHKLQLDEVANAVGPLKLYVIQVLGHTDSTGGKQYNLSLSQRRADAAIRYLTVQHNIPLANIHGLGYGATVPAEPNKTRAGRKANRRVEITVLVPQLESSPAAQLNQVPASGANQ